MSIHQNKLRPPAELKPRCATTLSTPPLLRVIRRTIRVSKVSGEIPRLMSYCSHSFPASLPTISSPHAHAPPFFWVKCKLPPRPFDF